MTGDVRDMLARRRRTHGEFCVTARLAQRLKTALRAPAAGVPVRFPTGETHWDVLPAEVREAADNICQKLARALMGNHREPDHWRDIQGYAQLVLDWIEKNERG